MTKSILYSDQIAVTSARLAEVDASPGSGKTTALIRRADHLVKSIDPSQILVLSFSNAAVRELKQRMRTDTRKSARLSSITVQTCHAFALQLLKQKRVLTPKQEHEVLVLALKSVRKTAKTDKALEQVDGLLQSHIKTVLDFISVARASKLSTSETVAMSRFKSLAPYARVLRAVRAAYSAQKKSRKSIDYADMLELATVAMKTSEIPYAHILVDEYQDCSPAQTRLLVRLAEKGCHIMTFGDAAQAIFGFSGAHYTPLSSVLDDVKQMALPTSHRLTSQIAATASAVAQHQSPIQTYNKGERPLLFKDKSQTEQTARIVKHIRALIADGATSKDIVVLARVRASLHPVESLLLAQGVPTTRRTSIRKRVHVLRVLKLVRFIERWEKNDSKKIKVDLLRATLPDGIADECRWKAAALELKKVVGTPSFEGRFGLCVKAYLRLMGGIRTNKELQADINRWIPISRGYKNAREMTSGIKSMTTETVETSTIHAAKGGEWKHVFIVGATEGVLPIYSACDSRDLLEERNLMYVAITRAKSTVSIYHAPTNHARSRQKFDGLSRFLAEPEVRKTIARG